MLLASLAADMKQIIDPVRIRFDYFRSFDSNKRGARGHVYAELKLLPTLSKRQKQILPTNELQQHQVSDQFLQSLF
jgi:hypothetical protein